MNENSNNTNKETAANVPAGQEIKRKSLMLVFSVVLLAVAVVYFAYAWYTKMASVSSLQFDAAQWDYRANYQSGEVYVNVYKYSNVENQKVAPGTEGYIPVKLSATESDTDISFQLTVIKDSLSAMFGERLIFYYRNGDTNPAYRKGYNAATDKYSGGYTADSLIEFDDDHLLENTIKFGQEKQVTFYWRWVYDAREAIEKGLASRPDGSSNTRYTTITETVWNQMKTDAAAMTSEQFLAKYPVYCSEWDAYDTQVGKYPDAYEDDMAALVKIFGAQIVPDLVSKS